MAMRLDDFLKQAQSVAGDVVRSVGIPFGAGAQNYMQNPVYRAADAVSSVGVGIPASQALTNAYNLAQNPQEEMRRRESEYQALTDDEKYATMYGMAAGRVHGITANPEINALKKEVEALKQHLAFLKSKGVKTTNELYHEKTVPEIVGEAGGIIKKPQTFNQFMNQYLDGGEITYHATDADFKEFDFKKLGTNTKSNTGELPAHNMAELGVWTNTQKLSKRMASKKDMEVVQKIKDPMEIDFNDLYEWSRSFDSGEELRNEIIKKGYDGLKVKDTEFGGTSYVAFFPDQVKTKQQLFDEWQKGQ